MDLTRAQALMAAAVAVAFTLGGCTAGAPGAAKSPSVASSSTPPPDTASAPPPGGVDAAFMARANAACRPFADWNDGHPFEFPGFTPSKPDVKMLPKVGAFFDSAPANHTFTPALRALGEPSTGKAAWDAWLAQLDISVALSRAQISDAKRADAAAFVANVNQVLAQTPALDSSMRAVGFAPNDPCARVF